MWEVWALRTQGMAPGIRPCPPPLALPSPSVARSEAEKQEEAAENTVTELQIEGMADNPLARVGIRTTGTTRAWGVMCGLEGRREWGYKAHATTPSGNQRHPPAPSLL